ncbi:hypothetical protein [uncultured Duncaniella sp.]|uniref:hypothetical protein n=1 Tax=uncultured Duncaniella sp. TaxID=2768039 RepID=UPI0025F8B3B0|nr:hypothetical protein [uncultured Duncaniella sp.]
MKKTSPLTSTGKKSRSITNIAATSAICKLPPLPVSKKFYAAIRQRVTDSCACLPNGKEVCKSALALIDTYLAMGKADLDWWPIECSLIFALVKPEIDRAIERSKAAKARAARKKKTMENAVGPNDMAGVETHECMPANQPDIENPVTQFSHDEEYPPCPETISLSRRQRRAMSRSPKRKWAKISSGGGKVGMR